MNSVLTQSEILLSLDLGFSAAKGNKAKLRKLIGTEDVNLADSDGRTALLVATFSGTAKAVSMLLAANADPNAQFMDGCTGTDLPPVFFFFFFFGCQRTSCRDCD